MKGKRNLLVSISVVLFVLTLPAADAFAVPQTINYQGYIEGSGSAPVNGTLSMTFSIYNAPTGGVSLWTETQDSVTVTDGVFSVALGSLTPINLPFEEQYYLGVKVESDAEMTPRAVLVSVPYAMRAKEADTAGYAATAGAADTATIATTANTANSAATADTLGDKTLSQLVSLLDSRYGNLGDSLVADFSAAPLSIGVNNTVDFTDLTQGTPTSWSWDFGDTGTSTLQNPSHTYTAIGDYTVTLTTGDGVTSNTATKVDHITVYPIPPGTITTVDSTGNVGQYTSIAIGADGLPVVSYRDNTNGDLKVAHCGNAYCTLGNYIYTVDSGGSVGMYTSIAIGSDNLPVISYYDGTNGDLKIAHCGDAYCGFSGKTTVDDGGVGNVGQYTSIAIGADGLPVISYHDYTYRDLKVAHCGNAICFSGNTITTVDSAGYVGSNTSITIGTDNLPVISYYDETNGDLKVAHCGDASCSSGNTITTVDSAGDVGYSTSIAIGTDGLPTISYYDGTDKDLKVLHCGDYTCTPATNTINTVDSAGDVGSSTSIAIGTDNLPVISYYDSTNGDLKIAHCGDASCSSGNAITTADSTGGWHTSIAMGADNLPIISYTNGVLKVAHCEDVECTFWP